MLEDRPRARMRGTREPRPIAGPVTPPPGHDDLVGRVQAYPRRRTYLLPALVDVHDELKWLPPWALELIGGHLRVPKSEVYGIASSFPDLRLAEPGLSVTRVCMGAACRQAGAPTLREQLSTGDVELRNADCLFICGVAPATEVDGRLIGRSDRVQEKQELRLPAGALVQDGTCTRAVSEGSLTNAVRVGCRGNCWQAPAWSDDGGITWQSADGTRWQAPGELRLLAEVGRTEPLNATGKYAALEKAQSMGSDAVWQLIKDSGLRGRGGAYFPVGAKWETARTTPADRKFLLVNAEEGEPGVYKDRHLLEGDPHRVLAGIQIAALGIGATDIVIFVNGEAHLARERLLAALANSPRPVPVEVRLGGGGYVLGEETALINAIHGLRSEPLARPPFPAVSGLFAAPTVINNTESLANLPDIVLHGAEWFRSVGTAQTPGTKLVCLAGAVQRPGLYEVALGTPLRVVLDEFGGGTTRPIGALLIGGPSGSILPPALLDTPFDVQPLQDVSAMVGAGGIVPLTEDQCPVAAVRELSAYNARESCGKCTPCREGTPRLLAMLSDLRTTSMDTLNDLNDVLTFGSLCGLGQMAPNPARALLRHFPEVVAEHQRGGCRFGVCA
jgi:NADH:ubiquinone oxidoreductase subunit F (NADH-binding)/NADH:ubiquinone oxidoreductase subunit E